MQFWLMMQLGNAAMQSQDDIGKALIKLGQRLRQGCRYGAVSREPTRGDCGVVLDDNGNHVGAWHVE